LTNFNNSFTTKVIAQLNVQLSQGSAAAGLRWGGRFYSSLLCSSFENAAEKVLLKLVNIWPSYCQNKKVHFYGQPVICDWRLWTLSSTWTMFDCVYVIHSIIS